MRLFREFPIESEEQAASMPDGAMAYLDDFDAYGAPSRSVAVKHRGSWWSDDRELPVTGWVALVPFEVEEKYFSRQRLCDADAETITVYTTRQVPPP